MTGASAIRGHDDPVRLTLRDGLLWGGALLVVLTVQASAAYVITNWRPEPDIAGGAPPAVMIELAPMPAAPEAADTDLPPDQELMVEQAEVKPTDNPVEEIPEEVVEPEPEPAPEDLPEPVETPEPLPEPLPEPEPEPVTEPVEEVIPDIVEAAEPAVAVPMPVRPSARLQAQRQRPRPTPPAQQAAPRTSAPPVVNAPSAPVAAAPQQSSTRAAPSVSPERWQSRLMTYLNRKKQYPRSSQSRREEGTAYLEFAIDPNGNVLSARIGRSSGFPDLDQAVLDMIRRASPVPAPPAELARPRMNLTIPIQFDL